MTNELAIRILTGDVLGTSEQTHDAIKKAVKALSADAVPVVRCKDCKHWDDVSITEKGHECNLTNGNKYKIRIATPSDWFCPMGERRSK